MKTTSKIALLVGICVGLMIGLYELSPLIVNGVIMWTGLSVLLVAVVWICRTIAESKSPDEWEECRFGHFKVKGENCPICRARVMGRTIRRG